MIPLAVVGAILRYACPTQIAGYDVHHLGRVLIWIGAVTTVVPIVVVAVYAWVVARITDRWA